MSPAVSTIVSGRMTFLKQSASSKGFGMWSGMIFGVHKAACAFIILSAEGIQREHTVGLILLLLLRHG